MFERARVRVAAWYIAVLAVVLMLFDAGVLTLMSQTLQDRLNSDLQAKASQASSAILDVAGTTYFEKGAISSDPDWADVSLYASTSSGTVIQAANPVAHGILPQREALTNALKGNGIFTTVGSGRDAFLVYSQPVYRKDIASVSGTDVIGVVQVARSMRTYNDTMAGLVSLVLGATGLALVVTFFALLWLAGKSLDPIRASLLRQKAFVSDASHELRTPVTVIRTAAESILRQKEGVSPRAAELARDIIAETAQLESLVTDLQDLAAADARVAMRSDPVDVRDLWQQVTSAGRLLAERRGVRLEDSMTARGQVSGDGFRLKQLLVILLDNATKFAPAGSAVRLVGETAGDRLVVRVGDTGPGIAEAELPHIFQRFYRGEAERGREGSGLGLAIAQWIAESHRGSISVRSAAGQGAEFSVELPMISEPAPSGAPVAEPAS
ncbi:MAG: hypothetical protein QOE92_108 [Chloroflexota bacterium]|jgi:signal transduction histidine kinase|nr:hypothetical protein [Chloroflexota bacterium]